jgi:sugar phosphate isomerase/epimerase
VKPELMPLSCGRIDNQGIPVPSSMALTAEQKADSMLAGLREAAALAERADVTLLLEPLNTIVDHPGYTLCHSAPAFELVRRVGSSRLKVLYDVYHMQIMEGNLIATMEANLAEIGHVHVADVPGRHEPGMGEINYGNIARMLKANSHGGSSDWSACRAGIRRQRSGRSKRCLSEEQSAIRIRSHVTCQQRADLSTHCTGPDCGGVLSRRAAGQVVDRGG